MAVLSNWMAEARRLESSGDVLGAVGIYRKALVRQEETVGFADLSLQNGLGDLYMRAGRVPEALEAYEHAAEQCEDQQLYANAIALCKKILRNAPEHLPTVRRVARLSALSGLEAEAKLNYLRLREGLERLGRGKEAIDCLREIVDASAEEESTLALVDALVGAGDPERALDVLRNVKDRRQADGRGVVLVVRRIQELQQRLNSEPVAPSEPETERTDGVAAAPAPQPRRDSARAVDTEDPSVSRVVGPSSPPADEEAPQHHRADEDPDDVTPLLRELQTALADLDGSARFKRALSLIDQMLELRPGNVELLSRKLHYAYVTANESAAISAYLELGVSLDRDLGGFNVRALSSVAADGRVTAAVRVDDASGVAPGS